MANTAVQYMAQKRCLARTHTNKYTRNHQGPTTLCGPVSSYGKGRKNSSLGGHHGTTISQALLFSPTWTSPTCSQLFYLTQVAQENNQDMKDKPHGQHTLVRFPLPGKSSGPGYAKGLSTSQHATSKASAVYERTHAQQNA